MAIKFLNSVNADSGVLYVDAANDKVGIGTTSPNRKLTIQNGSYTYPGGIDANSFFAIANDGWAGMNILSSRGTGGFIDFGDLDWGHRGRILYGQSTDYMSFDTAGSTKMTILSGGNVGIGTTSPSGKLHIDTYNTSNNALTIQASNWTARTYGIGIDSTSNLSFYDNFSSLARLVITSAGNVGIGTTSPGAKLHVYDATSNNLGIFESGDNLATIRLSDNDTSGYWHTQNSGTQLGVDSSYSANNLTVRSGGNVGIGTTSPSSDLDVVGNTRLGPDSEHAFQVTDDSNNNFLVLSSTQRTTASAARDIKFRSYGTDATDNVLVMDMSAGNVGIGNSEPRERLDVDGNIVTTWGNDRFIGLQYQDGGNYRNGLLLHGDNRSTAILSKGGSGSNPYIWFGGGVGTTSEWVRINAAGNVGINTTNPFEKLHVDGRIYVTSNPGSDGIVLAGAGSTNNPYAYIVSTDEGSQDVGMAFYVTTDAGTTNTEALRIDDAGNIQLPQYTAGILTSDASGNITVDTSAYLTSYTETQTLDDVTTLGTTTTNNITVGNITAQGGTFTQAGGGVKILNNGTSGYNANIFFGKSDGTDGYTIGQGVTANDGVFRIYNNGTVSVPLAIADNNDATFAGKVSIGTTSPTSPLHIVSDTNRTITLDFTITSGGYSWASFKQNSSEQFRIWGSTSQNYLSFYNDQQSSHQLTLASDGNVGIGTTSPGAKLDISGDTTTWSGMAKIFLTDSNSNSNSRNWSIGNGGTDFGSLSFIVSNAKDGVPEASTGTPVMSMDGVNKRIGIGTASPTAKLHISNTSGDANIILAGSSGQVLSIDQNSIRTTTASQIAIFTNSTTTNGLYINSAGNIGVGTTSPSEKLHVSGNVRIEGDLTVNGSYTQIDTDVNTTEQWNVTNDGTGPAVTINQTGAQDIMDVQDDGTSVFYIEDGGNVGIGTTDPGNQLEVSKSNSGGLGATLGLYNPGYNANSSSTINLGRTIDSNWEIKSESNTEGGRDYDLIFSERDKDDTAHQEYLRLKSTGALKISSYGSNTFTGTAAYALAVDSSGNVIETAVQGSPTGGSGTAGKLTKWDTSSTLTDSVITESSGNIGIGTASPSHTLDVNGELRVGTVVPQTSADFSVRRNGANIEFGHGNRTSGYYGTIGVQGNNGMPYIALSADCESSANTFTTRGFKGNVITTDGAGSLMFSQLTNANATGQSLTERMRLGSDGSLSFSITSDTSFPSASIKHNSNNYVYFSGGSNGALFGNSNQQVRLQVNATDMEFLTGGNTKAIIASNGNVGIGTTNPTATLTVVGNQLFDGTGINLKRTGVLSGRTWNFGVDSNGLSIYDVTSSAYRLTIDTSGNVGIGTTAPVSKLQVEGDIALANNGVIGQGNAYGNSGNSASSTLKLYDSATGATILNNQSYDIHLNTGGGTKFIVKNGGNVGIGTTSPLSLLHVNGDIRINNTDRFYVGNNASYITSTSNADIGIVANRHINFASVISGVEYERMRIEEGGNVGIGTTNPSQKLDVNGNVKADNFIGGNEAGIYTFNDTVNATGSEDIFSVSCSNGAAAFRVTFVCSTSGMSVAKTYEVVKSYGAAPVFFKVVDTGAYGGHDFDVSFTNSNSDTGVTCEITNNSTTINADIVTTVFLGGSPTTITVTAL